MVIAVAAAREGYFLVCPTGKLNGVCKLYLCKSCFQWCDGGFVAKDTFRKVFKHFKVVVGELALRSQLFPMINGVGGTGQNITETSKIVLFAKALFGMGILQDGCFGVSFQYNFALIKGDFQTVCSQ